MTSLEQIQTAIRETAPLAYPRGKPLALLRPARCPGMPTQDEAETEDLLGRAGARGINVMSSLALWRGPG